MAVEIALTIEQRDRCLWLAGEREGVTEENFSYATQWVRGRRVYKQYEVEVIGIFAECAFASWHDLPDEEWDYIGRRKDSTDFTLGGKTIEVKATYTPPSRNPRLAILPKGKRSDLYVLAYTTIESSMVSFLGYAKDEDFPEKPTVIPGWRNPTLNLRANQLRRFKDDYVC